MERCPWCRERVEQLHPLPPEVVSEGLVLEAGGADAVGSLEACAECVSAFMDGRPTP